MKVLYQDMHEKGGTLVILKIFNCKWTCNENHKMHDHYFNIINIWSIPGPMFVTKGNRYLLKLHEKLNYYQTFITATTIVFNLPQNFYYFHRICAIFKITFHKVRYCNLNFFLPSLKHYKSSNFSFIQVPKKKQF